MLMPSLTSHWYTVPLKVSAPWKKIEPATCSESPQETATPAMVSVCATQRGNTLQNRPEMMAAASGSSGMASSRFGLRVSFTRSALQGAQVFDVDAAALAEQHHEDGETDGGFGRGHGQHEEHEDLAIDVVEVTREGHEVEVHGQQQQLHAHQQQDEVLAVDEHARHRDGEQHAGQDQQPVERNHAPFSGVVDSGLTASTLTMRTRSSRRTATCAATFCCLSPARLRMVSEIAATMAISSSTAASS